LALPFCFFMDYTIYAIGVDQPWVVFMARNHIILFRLPYDAFTLKFGEILELKVTYFPDLC